MMGMIGGLCGLVGHTLYVIINVLADFKFSQTRWIIGHSNVALAWLFNISISLLFTAASSALCVGGAPEAIGSGIPEVMAYLNGIMVPKVFNVFTLVVKFFSCALAVASGLPVGPEGPLIHIGAALGSSLSQCQRDSDSDEALARNVTRPYSHCKFIIAIARWPFQLQQN